MFGDNGIDRPRFDRRVGGRRAHRIARPRPHRPVVNLLQRAVLDPVGGVNQLQVAHDRVVRTRVQIKPVVAVGRRVVLKDAAQHCRYLLVNVNAPLVILQVV